MRLFVYTPDFADRVCLYTAVSYTSEEYYNGLGKISVVAAATKKNIAALKPHAVVYDPDSKTSYFLLNVKYDPGSDRITANGVSSNWLLSKRAVIKFVKIPPGYAVGPVVEEAEKDVYSIVSDNLLQEYSVPTYGLDYDYAEGAVAQSRFEPLVTIAPLKNLNVGIIPYRRYSTTTADMFPTVLEAVIDSLGAAELGHRMVFDPLTHKFEFEIYQGVDRSMTVKFIEERGSLGGISFEFDETQFKNVAAVPMYYEGSKTDDGDKIATIRFFGSGEGTDRYEMFLPVQQEQPDEGESFLWRVHALAFKELADSINRQTFTAKGIDTADYGSAYALGDVITCVSNRLGVEFEARITCVRRTVDARRRDMELTLGDPILTVLGSSNLTGFMR